jgi:hypothetical protein
MFVNRKIVNVYHVHIFDSNGNYSNLTKIRKKAHFFLLSNPLALRHLVFYFKDEKDETSWLLSCTEIPQPFSTHAIDNKVSFKEAVNRKLQKDKSILFRPFHREHF